MTTILFASVLALGQLSAEPKDATRHGLVLTDAGLVYEGKIDTFADYVRVMSGGKTTMLKKVSVAFVAESRDEAYDFLKKKKKSDSAADAAGLAEWCRKNGLMKQAVEEAKLAAKLAPNDRALAKLLAEIEDDAKRPRPVVRVVGTAAPRDNLVKSETSIPAVSVPVMPGQPAAPTTSVAPGVEQFFVKSVQPVLMNACANCHADASKPVTFRIQRLPEGLTISPKSRENLAAAMGQLNAANAHASPLVTYAQTPHGGRSTPPIGKGSVALANLDAWAKEAVASLPKAPPVAAPSVAAMPTPVAVPVIAESPIVPPPPPEPAKPTAKPATPTPPASPAAADPFDPAEFNRRQAQSPKK